MLESFKRQILRYIGHSEYRPVKLSKLAKGLGIKAEDYAEFKKAFEQLRQAGHIIIGERSAVELRPLKGQVTGTFRANRQGFGFVSPLVPDSHDDLFIPPGDTASAMTGDIVAAKIVKRGRRGGQMRYTGKVVEILQRSSNRIVGALSKSKEGWLVRPEGKGYVEPVIVGDVSAKSAREKDKVVVEIVSWPTEKYFGQGVIVEVLGRAGQYQTEINSIVHRYQIPFKFNDACLSEAREATARFRDFGEKDRENITGKVIITIDPPDAKDFDDAISLEKDSNNTRILGVHIADVSFFVGEGTALDEEARQRGNSVYLPGRTIAMLPEVLSNGICSLQHEQKRFVKSVYTRYDDEGKVLVRRFARSVMNSAQRLTYEQADKALRGKRGEVKSEVVTLLKDMERLARIIEKRRIKDGMLHLDLPETELEMDKSGRVVDAHPADTSYPHTIIEMFMVEANEAVAALLDSLNVTFMRRIHPEPDAMSMKELAKLLRTVGFSFPKSGGRADIQALLESVRGTDASVAVNLLVLRSLEKAVYSPRNVGHYALASRHYCHFTSPIRRYADLLVHRLLDNYLEGKSLPKRQEQDLTEAGRHITFTEQRAEDAEDELKTVLILQMLEKHIGEELDGVVTGLANFGVFVQSKKFGIEGLISTEQLGGRWDYYPKSYCFAEQDSGATLRLGEGIKTRIVSVNLAARQLNLIPAEPLSKGAAKGKGKRKERGKGKRKRSGKYR
jgi:ribonuclease R